MTALFGFGGDGFVDASPPTTWSCTSDGGSSYIYSTRAWYGRDDDGNGYSYLYMPISSPNGGSYRLSFYTVGTAVGFGVGSTPPGGYAKPGFTQFDFRLNPRFSGRVFIRTDARTDTTVTNIAVEQLS